MKKYYINFIVHDERVNKVIFAESRKQAVTEAFGTFNLFAIKELEIWEVE